MNYHNKISRPVYYSQRLGEEENWKEKQMAYQCWDGYLTMIGHVHCTVSQQVRGSLFDPNCHEGNIMRKNIQNKTDKQGKEEIRETRH